MHNFTKRSVPTATGIGLKPQHFQEIIQTKPKIGWFEGHSENYFTEGGMNLYILEKIREHYPLSLHGVGLSLGSADGINKAHLQKLKQLVERFEPGIISEHLSWSNAGGHSINDLLPLPYTEESLEIICNNIDEAQTSLNRTLLIENPSTYLEFENSEIDEAAFLKMVAKKTGCGILLDINNIYVNHINHSYDIEYYLREIPKETVKEIHLAGHMPLTIEGKTILLDHHGDYVSDKVWKLYEKAIELFGPTPTLIEWDTNIPPLNSWLKEAEKATRILQEHA